MSASGISARKAYPGRKELQDYITHATIPTLTDFATRHEDQFCNWFPGAGDWTSLVSGWKDRFAKESRYCENKKEIKEALYVEEKLWRSVLTKIERKRKQDKALETFQLENYEIHSAVAIRSAGDLITRAKSKQTLVVESLSSRERIQSPAPEPPILPVKRTLSELTKECSDLSQDNLQDISFTSTSYHPPDSLDSNIDELILSKRHRLDMKELATMAADQTKYEMQIWATVEERLALSHIECMEEPEQAWDSKIRKHVDYVNNIDLGENIYKATRNWRKAMSKDELYFQPAATTLQQATIYNVLTNVNLNSKVDCRQLANGLSSMTEWAFIAKHVFPIVQPFFSARSEVQMDWNTPSKTFNNAEGGMCQRRPGMLFTCKGGVEIGNGEIKPPGTPHAKVEEDRARIAEMCKRQLQLRMKDAKDTKEFVTFGMMITGLNVFCEHEVQVWHSKNMHASDGFEQLQLHGGSDRGTPWLERDHGSLIML